MNITGKITGIKYKVSLAETLKVVDIMDFSINESSAYEHTEFIFSNSLIGDKQVLISELLREAGENGFEVRIEGVKC
jgi:hypothetical protein